MTTTAHTTIAAIFEAALEGLVAKVRAGRARRAQRLALRTLMEMDASRLDDLGISAADVRDAYENLPAGRHLEARRAARASYAMLDRGQCAHSLVCTVPVQG